MNPSWEMNMHSSMNGSTKGKTGSKVQKNHFLQHCVPDVGLDQNLICLRIFPHIVRDSSLYGILSDKGNTCIGMKPAYNSKYSEENEDKTFILWTKCVQKCFLWMNLEWLRSLLHFPIDEHYRYGCWGHTPAILFRMCFDLHHKHDSREANEYSKVVILLK